MDVASEFVAELVAGVSIRAGGISLAAVGVATAAVDATTHKLVMLSISSEPIAVRAWEFADVGAS